MNKKLKLIVFFVLTLLCISFLYLTSPKLILEEIRKEDINSSRYIILNKAIILYYYIFPKKIIGLITEFNEKHFSENIIFLLGSIGDQSCEDYLLKKVNDFSSNETNNPSNFFSLVNAVAIVKSDKVKNKLISLLENNNAKKWETLEIYFSSNWSIARALYLQTGELYSYHGRSGENVTITVSSGLETIRKILFDTNNRRNFSQIVELLKFVLPTKKSPEFYQTEVSYKSFRVSSS